MTEGTDADEGKGSLKIGACQVVDIDDSIVEEIEAEPSRSYLKIKIRVPGKAQSGENAEHTRRM